MPRWIFVRHGESVANQAGRFSGWQDVSLTARGKAQARAVGEQLLSHKIDQVLSSDLKRARATAQLAMAIWEQHHQPVPIVPLFPLLLRLYGQTLEDAMPHV